MKRFLNAMVGALAVAAMAGMSHAASITYTANLSGPAESPANASPGIGFAQIDFDIAAHTMRVRATFSGLLGTTTASHIHAATAVAGAGTAGVATQTPTFIGFPLGVTSGAYDFTFSSNQASSYNPAYVTANGGTAASAEAALFASLNAGTAYFNIHTSVFGAGEIRGFLTPVGATAVPVPAALPVGVGMLGAMVGVRVIGRKRKEKE